MHLDEVFSAEEDVLGLRVREAVVGRGEYGSCPHLEVSVENIPLMEVLERER